MPRFLHECYEDRNGRKVYNGWWEICGDYLYNRAGGRHRYEPKEDDEIKECEWEDIIRENLLDDSETTGWIAPDGTFYGCNPRRHRDVAVYIFDCEEIDLEEKGYCKIFQHPPLMRVKTGCKEFDYYPSWRNLTAAQREVLKKKGLIEEED